jgi:hypothetical protein
MLISITYSAGSSRHGSNGAAARSESGGTNYANVSNVRCKERDNIPGQVVVV